MSDIYHIYAPQDIAAETEADRAIKDKHGNTIDETYATKANVATKQDVLVSGENIKSINGESVLGSGNIDVKQMVNITYAELKALRDSGTLIPGRSYRITDYACTTTQTDTSSAGHAFDIIVIADSATKLNENARAIHHDGDTYFVDNNLAAWELRYCIDNDIARFAWADSANGKGVIYRLIDEFGNDVPYDFKNILFSNNSEVVFDNIYTFNLSVSNVNTDVSLLGYAKKCYSNAIDPYIQNGVRRLNKTVFLLKTSYDGSVMCYENQIRGTNYNNTFKNATVYQNTIEPNFALNNISSSFTQNIIGQDFTANIIIDDTFNFNHIAEGFTHNTIRGYFNANLIGRYFSYNDIGEYFNYNSIGYYFNHNSIGTQFTHNVIASEVFDNVIGNYFTHNNVEGPFSFNNIGNSTSENIYVRYCKFDNDIQYIVFTSDDTSASSSNYLQNVHIHSGIKGSSSSDRKTISVPDRNLEYSIDYYPNNSQTIILD